MYRKFQGKVFIPGTITFWLTFARFWRMNINGSPARK